MGKVQLWAAGSNPKNPDAYSVGRLAPGECMTWDRHNSLAATVVGKTDWSKVQGAATFPTSTKSLIGGDEVKGIVSRRRESVMRYAK